MRRILLLVVLVVLAGCSTVNTTTSQPVDPQPDAQLERIEVFN